MITGIGIEEILFLLAIGLLVVARSHVQALASEVQPRRLALKAVAGVGVFIVLAVAWAGREGVDAPMLWPLSVDRIAAIPLLVQLGALLVSLALVSRHAANPAALAGLMAISEGLMLAAVATSTWLSVLAWWLAMRPFRDGRFEADPEGVYARQRYRYLRFGLLAYTLAVLLDSLALGEIGSFGVGVLVVLAVASLKGLVPLSLGLVHACEGPALLAVALVFNGHLGALLLMRDAAGAGLALPDFVLPSVGVLAWLTGLGVAVLAISARRPRQLLALIMTSQATFIIAALAAGDTAAALVYWGLVTVASTGIIGAYLAAETRLPRVATGNGPFGLATRAPVLAVMFLICGLALVGAPGTIGFWAEDLLLHATVRHSLLVPVVLLLATALNAIHLLRLYVTIFLGAGPRQVVVVPDVLPRERFALLVCVLVLVVGGLWPALVTELWFLQGW